MRAVLLRTGSYAVQSPPVFPGSAQLSLYRHDSAPSLFSCERSSVNSLRTSLHLDFNRRGDAPATASGIRRAFLERDVIRSEVRFSRLTEAGSRSFPARIPEEEFLSESDDDGIGSLSTIDGIWPEIWIPVEEPSFPGDGFGRGGKNRGGGDGGNGIGNGEDRSKIGAYYLEMLKSNPGDSLLLRNYGKFLHEVEKDTVRAEEYYGRGILASPGDGELLSLYGKLIWDTQRDGDRAKSYFDQAVHASPDNCSVLGSYAHFMWEAEDEEEESMGASPALAPAL
ncbi:hypothetical protein F2P56_020211 [Juglans regia]|uniref:Uncharacterized protein n=2 Tax=Juglans regia TaxID=51240 RepID=A0A833UTD9_JUGRE|nr:uncharacterized protein LOC108982013 [Juglans regia]KAF5460333.1 hypothetical protein F2P56_020211 [Juglans regia]